MTARLSAGSTFGDCLGTGAVETVLDPGKDVVVERLKVNGVLSQQCGQAIDRWFSRLPNG